MIKRFIGIGLLLLIALIGAEAQQPVPPQPKTPSQPVPPQGRPPQAVPPQAVPPQGRPPQAVPPQGNPAQPKTPQQPPQGTPPQGGPPQNASNAQRAQVVRVNPDKGSIVLQSGTGKLAKEFEYRINPNTRIWGSDRAIVPNGLGYLGFQPGATVWYQSGTGDNAQSITEMRFYDPAQADRKVEVKPDAKVDLSTDLRGQIAQVDPAKSTLILRTADGEVVLRVAETARFWDANKVLIAEGLTYRGFRSGATVWVRFGMVDNARMVTEIRLFDPNQPDKDLRGEIVRVDPEKDVFVVRTGVGDVEYRVTASTRYWNANRVAFTEGLRHPAFRAQAAVWFRLGNIENTRVVTELRFFDPSTQEVMPDVRAQVVRVDPEKKTIRLLVGEANLAQEVEYKVADDTRIWDANKVPVTQLLAYTGFRQGAIVWYRLGTGANANVVTEIRFHDPGAMGVIVKAPDAKLEVVATDVRGRIIRVDPDRSVIIVRTGEGDTAREVEYRVNDTTRYWGTDRLIISEGLRYRGLQPNADIWYRTRTIDNVPVMTELRFYDPTAIKGRP